MKKLLVIMLAFLILAVPVMAEESVPDHGYLLAIGFSGDDAHDLIDKWERGEPLTPFQEVEYDEYNSPAEENGHGGDLLLLKGTVKEYVKTGNSSQYLVGIRLQQEDGKEWMISCAQYIDKTLVGAMWNGEKGETVFDGLEETKVEIYGKYLGYSEEFKLPVVDIIAYGGLLVPEEKHFISTRISTTLMQRDDIWDLGYLIGAKRYSESKDPAPMLSYYGGGTIIQ